tara:strand:- start:39 stop:800 length:762 start_codon:yes stop_codon:yes gene_type:complete
MSAAFKNNARIKLNEDGTIEVILSDTLASTILGAPMKPAKGKPGRPFMRLFPDSNKGTVGAVYYQTEKTARVILGHMSITANSATPEVSAYEAFDAHYKLHPVEQDKHSARVGRARKTLVKTLEQILRDSMRDESTLDIGNMEGETMTVDFKKRIQAAISRVVGNWKNVVSLARGETVVGRLIQENGTDAWSNEGVYVSTKSGTMGTRKLQDRASLQITISDDGDLEELREMLAAVKKQEDRAAKARAAEAVG